MMIKTALLSHPGLDTKRQRQSGILFYHGMEISILLKVPAAKLISRCSRVQLCHPIDGSPPGSLIPGILQARTLEWVAISFSNA